MSYTRIHLEALSNEDLVDVYLTSRKILKEKKMLDFISSKAKEYIKRSETTTNVIPEKGNIGEYPLLMRH